MLCMKRIGECVLIVLLLALAVFLSGREPQHSPFSVDGETPLARAERVPAFVRGDGTNYVQSRGPFTSAHWYPEGLTVIPDAEVAPDGTRTAVQLVEKDGARIHRIIANLSSMTPASARTLSLYVKRGERAAIQFEMADSPTANYGIARFDLLKEQVVAEIGDVTDVGIQKLPGGWYRCWVVMPYAKATEGFNFALMDQNDLVDYPGNSGSGLFVWGVQFEPGNEPRGYSGP